jgi:hypothetical protein
MTRLILVAGALAALSCGGASRQQVTSFPATDGTTYVAGHGMVPAGTTLWAQIDEHGTGGGSVQVTTIADVRSRDGREVLIPRGSVLLGQVLHSDGLREQIVFNTLEMEGAPQRVRVEVLTNEGAGVPHLMPGTKLQLVLRAPISSLATVRPRYE